MFPPHVVDRAGSGRRTAMGARSRRTYVWPMIVALLLAAPGPVAAKVEIVGAPDAMQLSAEEAPLREVLAAMAAQFNLTYEPTPELDRLVGGTYSGTLQQVLARILDGYDYVTNFSPNGIELKVWGPSRAIPYLGSGAAHNPVAPASQVPPPPAPIRSPGMPGHPMANTHAPPR